MTRGHLEIGQVVAGRYEIVDLIGEGGMGTIYRARHIKLPRTFALKLLKPELSADADFVARFLREAVAASQVIHPNVVYVTDFGQIEDGSYYIGMEYLEGVGLDEVLERQGRLRLQRALDILIQLADALDYCHGMDIVHRDLKTENILLCTIRGRHDVVKLVDFGIARMIGSELSQWQITQGGVIFGTPEYISPERALDADVDGRSDIYALGVIAFELVTGLPPFTGKYTQLLKAHVGQAPPKPSSRIREPLPAAFDALVLKCLAKRPEARYQTCGELLQELLRLRGQLAGGAAGPSLQADGPPRRPTTTGAWGPLAVKRPTAGSTASDASPPETDPLEGLGRAVHVATAAAALRTELRNVLKELAVQLAEPAQPTSMLPRQLEQVLSAERRCQALTDELDLLVEQREQLRAESDEYAGALGQLLLEITAVAARDDPAADAYGAQRQALGRHLDTLREGRDRRREAVLHEIDDHRTERQRHETELAQLYFGLYGNVVALRGTEPALPLERLYVRLDELQSRLAATWTEIR